MAGEESGEGESLTTQFYVCIMASYRGTLYVGVTNDLERRVYEHLNKLVDGFTKRYNVSKLVYYEAGEDINAAIEREKQIKGWVRSKRAALIDSMNPYWKDLSEEWRDATPPQTLRPPVTDSGRQGEGGGLRVTASSDGRQTVPAERGKASLAEKLRDRTQRC